MLDVPSNVIWIVGLVLLVLALAFLWNMTLSTHAEPMIRVDKEPEIMSQESEATSRRYKGMPVLAPASPPAEILLEEPQEIADQVIVIMAEPDLSTYEDVPDCDDAERMLDLAWKLEVNGDFEGRDEYASMVATKTDASPRQRDRAQAMLRRDSIA